MKYAVIGAGISGLSIANLLKENNEVVVFESASRSGGMIKCDVIEGNLFHRTGGHVFNTKREDVLKWFWSYFNKDDQFIKTARNASVFMSDGKVVPYPIENHIYMLEKHTCTDVVSDFVRMVKCDGEVPANFEEFLKKRFGNALYSIYFKPYNEKVWRRDLTKVPLSWLEGKLPMPSVEEMILNNICHIEEKTFVHSSFYYPVNGGSQFLADTFSQGLDIRYNQQVERIFKHRERLSIQGEEFDRVIFCGNIKQLPSLLINNPEIDGYINDIEALEFHGTTSVFCKIEANPYSWIYLPSREYESHRIICTGNFSPSNNVERELTGTIEFTDYISEEDIKNNLLKMPLHPRYITHHYEKYTYPIQDKDTRLMVKSLKKTLASNNIYLCGRFAEWEYANMDVCMGYAIDLYKELLR